MAKLPLLRLAIVAGRPGELMPPSDALQGKRNLPAGFVRDQVRQLLHLVDEAAFQALATLVILGAKSLDLGHQRVVGVSGLEAHADPPVGRRPCGPSCSRASAPGSAQRPRRSRRRRDA